MPFVKFHTDKILYDLKNVVNTYVQKHCLNQQKEQLFFLHTNELQEWQISQQSNMTFRLLRSKETSPFKYKPIYSEAPLDRVFTNYHAIP